MEPPNTRGRNSTNSHKLFQRISKEKILARSSCESCITFTGEPEPGKGTVRETADWFLYNHSCKNPLKSTFQTEPNNT